MLTQSAEQVSDIRKMNSDIGKIALNSLAGHLPFGPTKGFFKYYLNSIAIWRANILST